MEIESTLASGEGSKIKKITHDGRTCAVKILFRETISDRNIMKEVRIHKSLNHRRIIQYITDFSDQQSHSIVLEYGAYCLRSLISPEIGLRPAVAHMIFVQLISAVEYLHSKHICHRDIKPDNILISLDGNAKLADFGYSTLFYYKGHRRLRSIAGSYSFMAPEVLRNDYDGPACDVWSCGMTLLNMLTGKMPWKLATGEDSKYRAFKQMRFHHYDPFNQIRDKTMHLIKNMLAVEKQRYTVGEIMLDPWFLQDNNLTNGEGDCIDQSYLEFSESIIDLHYTQPDQINGNRCFMNSSMPVQCSELPMLYNMYVGCSPCDAMVSIKKVLEEMIVQCNHKDDSIVFSTTDTKKNRLNGEIVVQRIDGKSRLTIQRKQGDLREFQRFVRCILSNNHWCL